MDFAQLRPTLRTHIGRSKDSVTHTQLYGFCRELGLSVDFEPTAISKYDRLSEALDRTPDNALPEVAARVLQKISLSPTDRNYLQELIWPKGPAISKRCRREISQLLDVDSLFRDASKFDDLISSLFVLNSGDDFAFLSYDPNGRDKSEIERHVYRNPGDWSVEYLFDFLGAFDVSDRRFAVFLEGLSHADVQTDSARQKAYVDCINPRLKEEGLEFQEVGIADGYPEYRLLPITGVFRAKPKNLIFASSEKPDLRFRDAVNNDIEIVSNADKVLVYDRPISNDGLTWGELQDWWKQTQSLETDEEAKRKLYLRLLGSLPTESPPQALFFKTYFAVYRQHIPSLPALLPEVWMHWDPRTVRERGTHALIRSRMDFLLLLPSKIRVVIEIDGQQHYSENGTPSPRKYAEMVAADRSLKLDGYQVYRFGGSELNERNAEELVSSFFSRLYSTHGVVSAN